MGIGFTPAILALVAYAILPILRNTIAGIESLALESSAEVVVEYVGDSRERFRRAVRRQLEAGISGFMVEALPYESRPVPLYKPMFEAGIPLVLVRTPVDGLYLGGGSTLAPGTFFSGLIDDVRIYSRVVHP